MHYNREHRDHLREIASFHSRRSLTAPRPARVEDMRRGTALLAEAGRHSEPREVDPEDGIARDRSVPVRDSPRGVAVSSRLHASQPIRGGGQVRQDRIEHKPGTRVSENSARGAHRTGMKAALGR